MCVSLLLQPNYYRLSLKCRTEKLQLACLVTSNRHNSFYDQVGPLCLSPCCNFPISVAVINTVLNSQREDTISNAGHFIINLQGERVREANETEVRDRAGER